MVDIQSGFQENTIGAIEQFAEIASVDPAVAAMMFSGAILTGFAIGVFGIATLGAVLAALKRGLSGPQEPNQPV